MRGKDERRKKKETQGISSDESGSTRRKFKKIKFYVNKYYVA